MTGTAESVFRWRPDPGALRERLESMRGWTGFISFSSPGDDYVKTEREYKDQACKEIRALFAPEALRQGLASGDLSGLARRFATYRGKRGFSNMLNWRSLDKVFKPIARDSTRIAKYTVIVDALCALQEPGHDTAEVMEALAEGLCTDNPGVVRRQMWSHVSYLAMMLVPDRYVYVKPSITDAFLKLVGIDWARPKAFTGAAFATFTEVARAIAEEMAAQGLPPRDMIDLQSFMWISVTTPEEGAMSIPERLRLAVEALTPGHPRGVTEAEIRQYLEINHPRDDEEAPWADVELMPGDWAIWAGYEIPCNNSYTTGHFLKRVCGMQPFRYVGMNAMVCAPDENAEELASEIELKILEANNVWRRGERGSQQALTSSVSFVSDVTLNQWAPTAVLELASELGAEGGARTYGAFNVLALPAGIPLRDLAIASFVRWATSTGDSCIIERAKLLSDPALSPDTVLLVPPPWAAAPLAADDALTRPPIYPARAKEVLLSYVCPPFADIASRVAGAGLRLAPDTLRRYHLATRTRGFVVLAGVSGSGKTWLAEVYAEAVGAALQLVPVAPNWNTNEDLLGYHNPFTGTYADTAASRFVREASRAFADAEARGIAPCPYHLVLDEMNLARVEHYFARFLSALEIRARQGHAPLELGPNELVVLPPNLVFVGTVNVDETTHGFADKVYDRAHVIELSPARSDIATHLGDAPYREVMLKVWDAMRPVAPFAFRVLDDVRAYVEAAAELQVPWQVAVDEQLLHKVLPRVKGTDVRLGAALEAFIAATDEHPASQMRARLLLDGFGAHGFASFF